MASKTQLKNKFYEMIEIWKNKIFYEMIEIWKRVSIYTFDGFQSILIEKNKK